MPQADEQDTSVDEAVDTSTNDEPEDTGDLEDIEVAPEDLGDETEQAEDSEDEDTDTEPESDEEETDVDDDSEDNVSNEPSVEEKQKAFNKEMAERRIQEKQLREQAVKEQQQEYIAEAEDDPIQQAVRENQVATYNLKVDANTSKLTTAYEKAIKDFDILSSEDPAVKAEIDNALDAFQAMHVTIDRFGNPADIRGDLYQFLQSKANSIQQLTGIGAKQQQTNKGKEKSKTFTPPSRAPKEPKVDADVEAFDEEAKKYQRRKGITNGY